MCLFSALIYAYGIVQSARWVFLDTSVRIQPEPERRGLDSDTSAEKTHLAICIFSHACNLKQLQKLTWVCTSVHRRQLLLVHGCPTWRRWKMCGFLPIITPHAHLHIRLPDLFSRPGDINVDYHNIGLTMLNAYESII